MGGGNFKLESDGFGSKDSKAGFARDGADRKRSGRQSVSAAFAQLMMSAGLLVCISVLAVSMSVGFARAQSQQALGEPDTGLVITLLVITIAVMGLLSAAAVRFAGRGRPRRRETWRA